MFQVQRKPRKDKTWQLLPIYHSRPRADQPYTLLYLDVALFRKQMQSQLRTR